MNKTINFKLEIKPTSFKMSGLIILALAVLANSCNLTEAQLSIKKEPIQLGFLHDPKFSSEFQDTILTATNLINKQNSLSNWFLNTTVIEV